MTCRERKGGSAVTTLAQQIGGLKERQALSLYHQLRHEGAGMEFAPTASNSVLDGLEAAVRQSDTMTDARKASVMRRIEAARSEDVTPADLWAMGTMLHRSHLAKEAVDAHVRRIGERCGLDDDAAKRRFAGLYQEGTDKANGLSAPADWAERFRNDPQNGFVPSDRGTLYALWRMEQDVPAAPEVANPVRHPVRHASSLVRAVGYDPASGRMDVELANGRVYVYDNVSAEVARDITTSYSPGRVYNRRVRGGASGSFVAGGEHDRQRCSSCGQFAAEGHVCPTRTEQPAAPVAIPQSTPEGSGLPKLNSESRIVRGLDTPIVMPLRREVHHFAAEHPAFHMQVSLGGRQSEAVEGEVVVHRENGHYAVRDHSLRCRCDDFATTGLCDHTFAATDATEAYLNGRRGIVSLATISEAARIVRQG